MLVSTASPGPLSPLSFYHDPSPARLAYKDSLSYAHDTSYTDPLVPYLTALAETEIPAVLDSWQFTYLS